MPSNNKLALFLAASIGAAAAQAAPPVLIDGSETGLRDDLAWLADRGRISLGLTTWPQPLGIVQSALDKVKAGELDAADRDALERAQAAIRRLGGGAAVGVRVNTARHPSAGADTETVPRSRIEAYGVVQGSNDDDLAWRLRARLQKDRITREPSPAGWEDSYVAYGGDAAVISAGAVDRWWGPGRFGSVQLSDAAPPVPTIALRRGKEDAAASPWLSWIGPWTYELSVGQPTFYDPRATKTIGMRLVARPFEGLELGASRYVYWGGEGTDRSGKSLGRALTGRSNVDSGPDPSNEISGFDVRLSRSIGAASVVGYVQAVGEDEAGYVPTKYLVTAGMQLKHTLNDWRLDWTAEASDTRVNQVFGFGDESSGAVAYRHPTFVDGHYQAGLPVGAFIGGNGVVGGAGLVLVPLGSADERRYEVRYWHARVSRYGIEPIDAAYGVPGKVDGALVRASGVMRSFRWSVGVSVQDYAESGRPRAGLIGSIEVPLGGR